MFGSLLFVLSTLGAVPAGTMPLVTCARPVAKLVVPKIEHVAGATRSTDCHQIALWLRRWEQTVIIRYRSYTRSICSVWN